MWHKIKWLSSNMEIRNQQTECIQAFRGAYAQAALLEADGYAREPGQLIDISTINEFPE